MVRKDLSEEMMFKLKSIKKKKWRKPCKGCMQKGLEKQGPVTGKSCWHGLGFDKWLV